MVQITCKSKNRTKSNFEPENQWLHQQDMWQPGIESHVFGDVSVADEVAVRDWLMASKMWNRVKSGKRD